MDEAVFLFGSWIEGEVREATSKVKNEKDADRKASETLQRCLTDPTDPKEAPVVEAPKSKFRDPAGLVGRL